MSYSPHSTRTNGNVSQEPPHSLDAEMAVLGAMMLERTASDRAVEVLKAPSMFYPERHRIIYSAMISLYTENKPIDIVTLNEELRRIGKLGDVGGSYYLSELNMRTPTAANVEHHARIVYENYLRRKLGEWGGDIRSRALEHGSDAFDVLTDARAALDSIEENQIGRQSQSFDSLLTSTIEWIQGNEEARKEGRVTGVAAGFGVIDSMTQGFQPSDLIILAARPSMGKTALAMAIARNAAIDFRDRYQRECAATKAVTVEKPRMGGVAFFSLEMSAQQLIARLLSAETGINGEDLREGDLAPLEWQTLMTAHHRLVGLPLYIDDRPGMSMMELRAAARLMQREHNIGMIVVDYLQLMHAPKAESREREISMISRGLKQLAKELDIPIIALSQLNRSLESRADKRPMLSDLRESGSLEQDADVVMFVHRPEYYGINVDEDGNSTEGIAEIIIGKQRNGPTGSRKLVFLRELSRFVDLAHHIDAQRGSVTYPEPS